MLLYLGVPIQEQSYMFGNKKSVIDSFTHVHAKLHKRHNMLSFHHVHEAVACGMIRFSFIPGDSNPAEIYWSNVNYKKCIQEELPYTVSVGPMIVIFQSV